MLRLDGTCGGSDHSTCSPTPDSTCRQVTQPSIVATPFVEEGPLIFTHWELLLLKSKPLVTGRLWYSQDISTFHWRIGGDLSSSWLTLSLDLVFTDHYQSSCEYSSTQSSTSSSSLSSVSSGFLAAIVKQQSPNPTLPLHALLQPSPYSLAEFPTRIPTSNRTIFGFLGLF